VLRFSYFEDWMDVEEFISIIANFQESLERFTFSGIGEKLSRDSDERGLGQVTFPKLKQLSEFERVWRSTHTTSPTDSCTTHQTWCEFEFRRFKSTAVLRIMLTFGKYSQRCKKSFLSETGCRDHQTTYWHIRSEYNEYEGHKSRK